MLLVGWLVSSLSLMTGENQLSDRQISAVLGLAAGSTSSKRSYSVAQEGSPKQTCSADCWEATETDLAYFRGARLKALTTHVPVPDVGQSICDSTLRGLRPSLGRAFSLDDSLPRCPSARSHGFIRGHLTSEGSSPQSKQ